MLKFIIVTNCFLLLVGVYCNNPLIRKTTNGPVEGIKKKSSMGKYYYAFLGIPFAEPPINDLRFKVPEPLKRTWKHLKVQSYEKFCVPSDTDSFSTEDKSKTNENCLFVNIFVPAGGREKKTVLVYIHGGGFSFSDAGDDLYGPDFLIDHDNVLVKIQYRVGIFGFLNLGLRSYSGNMGLKDQQLALKWIHENIENFSGNNNEILLFGESAGGASVGFQMLNPESRQYFQRALLSSSTAVCHYAHTKRNHLKRMQKLTKINDTMMLIKYLKKAKSDILGSLYETNSRTSNTSCVAWAPTIELPYAEHSFITQTPEQIYKSNNPPVMDVIFAFNSKESVGLKPYLIGNQEPLLKNSYIELPFDGFNISDHPKEFKYALSKLKKVYYDGATSGQAIERANINLISDSIIGFSTLKNVILQTNANRKLRKKTFLYRFSMNLLQATPHRGQSLGLPEGATHGDDICYYFHCHMYDHLELYDIHLKKRNGATYNAIKRMTTMITNFARTGNPSIENDSEFISSNPRTVFCTELTNQPKSSVTVNIEKQLHYDTWSEIEKVYKQLHIDSNGCDSL